MKTAGRIALLYSWALLATFAAIHLGHGLFHAADPDEFQALRNAFNASRAQIPYVDFWDNHGPLMIWIMQPILSLWSGGHELIYWLRGIVWLNTMLLAGGVFLLVRRLNPLLRAAPWIATAFLLSTPPFLSKAIEIRGDNPTNLLAAAALFFLIVALQKRNSLSCFAVGLCVGLMAGFTLKTLIIAAALTLFYACWQLREKRHPCLANLVFVAGGAAIPTVFIASALHFNGSLPSFISFFLTGNISREFGGVTSSEFLEIFKLAPVWTTLATSIIGLSLQRAVHKQADAVETGLVAMVLFYGAVFLLLLPTKNMQSLLPIYLPLALLAGYTVKHLAERDLLRNRKLVVAVAVILPLLLIRDSNSYSNLRNHGLSKQVAFANQTLTQTANQKYIFDPTGIVFLKPTPGMFHVLVTFIRELHQAGTVNLEIPDLLNQNDIKAVVFDRRTKDLRTADVAHIIANYAPILKGPNCYLLGLAPPETASNLTTATIPSAFSNWDKNAFEDAKVPNQPYNPPKWYQPINTSDN